MAALESPRIDRLKSQVGLFKSFQSGSLAVVVSHLEAFGECVDAGCCFLLKGVVSGGCGLFKVFYCFAPVFRFVAVEPFFAEFVEFCQGFFL